VEVVSAAVFAVEQTEQAVGGRPPQYGPAPPSLYGRQSATPARYQDRAPQYLMNCCHPASDVASRQRLRSSSRHHLVVPHRRSTLGHRAFSVAGPMAWNALPDDLRDPSLSENIFRKRLKTHLFRNALGHVAHERRCIMCYINLRLTYLLTYLVPPSRPCLHCRLQCGSRFPRPIASHAHCCSCLTR